MAGRSCQPSTLIIILAASAIYTDYPIAPFSKIVLIRQSIPVQCNLCFFILKRALQKPFSESDREVDSG